MVDIKPYYDEELKSLLRSPGVTEFEVVPAKGEYRQTRDNWVIRENGRPVPGGGYSTKRPAVRDARKMAKQSRGSVVITFYKDGGLEDYTHYSNVR